MAMSKLAWGIAIVLGLILLVVLVGPFLFFPLLGHMAGYRYGGMMGPGMMGGYGGFGIILPLLFLILIVAGIAWLIFLARGAQGTGTPPAAETPLDILKRRYASGEITKKQYKEIKRDLGI
jgi:putative membrane protein